MRGPLMPPGPMPMAERRSGMAAKLAVPEVTSPLMAVHPGGPPLAPRLVVRYTRLVPASSRFGSVGSMTKGAMNDVGSVQAGSCGFEAGRDGPASLKFVNGLGGSVEKELPRRIP